jgi:hypothetical protein
VNGDNPDFVPLALCLYTRKRLPRNGFVQVGLWEVCPIGTDNALGRVTEAVSIGPSNHRQPPEWIALDKLQTSRCRWSNAGLGPNVLLCCDSLSYVIANNGIELEPVVRVAVRDLRVTRWLTIRLCGSRLASTPSSQA